MKKKNLFRRFPALMICSMLLVSPLLLCKMGLDQLNRSRIIEREAEDNLIWEEGTMPGQGGQAVLQASSQQASQSQKETPESSQSRQETLQSGLQQSREPQLQSQTPEDVFSRALFIGDSRSVGILEYAGLEGPDFFASSGMNLFCLWEKEISVPGVGKLTLEELLKQKTYDTIFLMTGINELGYEHSAIVKRYAETVQAIEELQPEAMLYLCANLHVTKSRSDRDDIYNNSNIDWLNGEIAALADGSRRTYIDVNPLFDDQEGALRSDYSGDDTHPYGKYYQEWGRWLYEICAGLRTPR